MAEAVVSDLLQVVFEKPASPILEQYGLLSVVREEMENLRSTLSMIQAEDAEVENLRSTLSMIQAEDAEERRVKDKALRNWLGKLKDSAYDADEILDEFTAESLRGQVEIRRRVTNKVHDFFSLSNPLTFHLNMGHKIKEISEQTDSFVIESDVYGREEDKQKVIELLISEDNRGDVTIIPVVGMGGVGKITFHQLTDNDVNVERHFDLRMWVCVSDDFDVRRLTKAILEYADDKNSQTL